MMKTDIGGCSRPIVMALSLNKLKKTERIIIAPMDEVDAWLAGTGNLTAIYDVVRPLGTFLLEHQAQKRENGRRMRERFWWKLRLPFSTGRKRSLRHGIF